MKQGCAKSFQGVKGRVKFKEPLSLHTTFRIGGKASFFIEPEDVVDLRRVVVSAKRSQMPLKIIGAGSNILVRDEGVEAAVLKLSAPFFWKTSFDRERVRAGSGISLGRLQQTARARSLSGVEFLAGIPGSLGGALVMNAGAWGRCMGDLVENVRVMDHNGKIKVIPRGKIRFGYRSSSLAEYIILGARLKLHKKNKKEIDSVLKEYKRLRKEAQDYSSSSAGCVFKNPPGESAGRLIDLCGLKGKKRGGARVSPKHANFIVNQNKAKAVDVLRLMEEIKKKVKQKFNIGLEPEIRIWE